MRTAINVACSQCSTLFDMLLAQWSSKLLSVLSISQADCVVCKNCMHLRVENEIVKYLSIITWQKIKAVQNLGKPETLYEGIDYSTTDDGYWVLSAWYLLRQGKCCKNNCRNCPYPKKSKT